MDIIERLWRQAEPHVFITKAQFVASLEGWEITPREIDGALVGATLVKGPEFHFASFGTGKRFSAALIAACLQPIIDRYGFVRTMTPKDDVRQRRLNLLIGFTVETEDEFFTHFRMDRLTLHKGTKCPS